MRKMAQACARRERPWPNPLVYAGNWLFNSMFKVTGAVLGQTVTYFVTHAAVLDCCGDNSLIPPAPCHTHACPTAGAQAKRYRTSFLEAALRQEVAYYDTQATAGVQTVQVLSAAALQLARIQGRRQMLESGVRRNSVFELLLTTSVPCDCSPCAPMH